MYVATQPTTQKRCCQTLVKQRSSRNNHPPSHTPSCALPRRWLTRRGVKREAGCKSLARVQRGEKNKTRVTGRDGTLPVRLSYSVDEPTVQKRREGKKKLGKRSSSLAITQKTSGRLTLHFSPFPLSAPLRFSQYPRDE